MKRLLLILFMFLLLSFPTMASVETKISIVSCETDIKLSKYDNDTQIILGVKDESGNEFTNVYLEQQIRRSDKGYSYILEGSNCIYLDDVEYKRVENSKSVSFWGWLIFLLIMMIVVSGWKKI